MSAFRLGKRLGKRLGNSPPLPNWLGKIDLVRQGARLTGEAIYSPINKGSRKLVRQLGKLGKTFSEGKKQGGIIRRCLTCLTESKTDPNSPLRAARAKDANLHICTTHFRPVAGMNHNPPQ